MKRVLAGIFGTFFIVFIGVLIAWCAYMILSEKAPGQYAEKLLDDKIELDFQGDDIRALFKEMEELLQYGEDGWSLGRVTVRQSKNSKETIKYDNIYLYYKPEDEAESIYRRIRILNENARWYVVEALQQDKVHELVHMDENMSETMLKEIWMSDCGNKEFVVYKNSEPKVMACCTSCGNQITLYDLIEYPCATTARDPEEELEKVISKSNDKFNIAVIIQYSDEFAFDDERFDENDITWCQIFLYDNDNLQSIMIVDDETA